MQFGKYFFGIKKYFHFYSVLFNVYNLLSKNTLINKKNICYNGLKMRSDDCYLFFNVKNNNNLIKIQKLVQISSY